MGMRSLFGAGSGRSIFKNGRSILKNGHSILKNGRSIFKNGRPILKNGRSILKNGRSKAPHGRRSDQRGIDDRPARKARLAGLQEFSHLGEPGHAQLVFLHEMAEMEQGRGIRHAPGVGRGRGMGAEAVCDVRLPAGHAPGGSFHPRGGRTGFFAVARRVHGMGGWT
jgi:hypothetical protein